MNVKWQIVAVAMLIQKFVKIALKDLPVMAVSA
jgi:hypothetical protein